MDTFKTTEQQQNNRKMFQYRRINIHPKSDYSKSLYNIALTPQMQSETYMPRSMSAINENMTDWKGNLCGMFQKSPAHDDESNSYQKPEDLKHSRPKDVPRSRSYQYTITTPLDVENGFSSSGSVYISVPMRNKKKRKLYDRSSGGYFFDKYMKRLFDKYVKKEECKTALKSPNKQLILRIKSNRQDIILADYFSAETKDAIYNLFPPRLPKSDITDENKPSLLSKHNSGSIKGICECGRIGNKHDTAENQSPCEPACPFSLRFWGDANMEKSSAFAQSYCPTPSISESQIKSSCRYCDTNSETLKAMETLYLCNFKVSMEGDWLCLKEISENSSNIDCLTTSSFSGSQNFENKGFWPSFDAVENIAPEFKNSKRGHNTTPPETRNKDSDDGNGQDNGMNCLNTSSCLPEDELQNQIAVTDCSLCLRNGDEADNKNNKEKIRSLLYQNNYLKERTRHLESSCFEAQRKCEEIEKQNRMLTSQLNKFNSETTPEQISEVSDPVTLESPPKNKIELQNLINQNLTLDVGTFEKESLGLISIQEQLDSVRAINMDIYNKLQTKNAEKKCNEI